VVDKRILIVDDEDGIVDVLASILNDEGYVAEGASNGREALEIMAARPPSLVLLDTMMPVMDGQAVLNAMRADPALAEVPVIMMTAMAAFPALLGGPVAEAYLFKPFDLDALLTRIHRLLGAAGSASGAGER
jgi:CheY-like chemotaxis protein